MSNNNFNRPQSALNMPSKPPVTALDRNNFGPGGNVSKEDALAFAMRLPAFQNWEQKLITNFGSSTKPGTKYNGIKVLEIYPFGPAKTALRGFVLAEASVQKGGKPVPGAALIRGAAVCCLVILVDEEANEYTVTVTQPRVPGAEDNYEELFAGMVDDAGSLSVVTMKEAKEELGLDIKARDLVKLSDMYPSIGGCDEMIRVYVHRRKMPKAMIDSFIKKQTGKNDEQEQIITRVRTYQEFKDACRNGEITDAKAQLALGMYEMLKAEKGLEAVPAVGSIGGRRHHGKKHTRKSKKSHKKGTRKH